MTDPSTLDLPELDVSTTELNGDQCLTALYLRDAAPRLRSETVASTLREATVRRAQALELNDAVVQGLTASLMSMQGGDIAECEIYLQRPLESARQMMNDWLEPLGVVSVLSETGVVATAIWALRSGRSAS